MHEVTILEIGVGDAILAGRPREFKLLDQTFDRLFKSECEMEEDLQAVKDELEVAKRPRRSLIGCAVIMASNLPSK